MSDSPSWQNQPPYSPSSNGQQDGSWYSGQGSNSGSGDGSGNPPANADWIPLYGDAKGSAQFGRPLCEVS